jgi:superfamily II DNA/RNA helicase
MSFTELGLPAALIAALAKQQITEPTAIQIAALPVLLANKDAYLHAETGTGKTLAYLLPVFCQLDPALAATQTVIIAPTHELAIQIQRQCCDLAQNAALPLRTLLLIGGTAMSRQLDKLKKKPHIVVGSPGRIGELLDMGKLKAQHLKHIAIDEADRMLREESLPTIRAIIKKAPATRQLIFASATIEAGSRSNIEAISPQLVMVQAGAAPVNQNIEHYYLVCDERDKADMIRKLYHALQPERAMVFVHRNSTANFVAAKLHQQQIPVADLSGAMNKVDRKQAMDDFRSAYARVLLTSDVAARGLDIKDVTHVFNLDVPTLSKDYLHRVGRTGRAGAKGTAITLMTTAEAKLAQRFEQELDISMKQVRLRDGKMSES